MCEMWEGSNKYWEDYIVLTVLLPLNTQHIFIPSNWKTALVIGIVPYGWKLNKLWIVNISLNFNECNQQSTHKKNLDSIEFHFYCIKIFSIRFLWQWYTIHRHALKTKNDNWAGWESSK